MSRRTTKLLKAALSTLHYTGVDRLVAPYTSADGVILTLHHVTPETPRGFEPNSILKVTPEFLESVIIHMRAAGFEFIALDQVKARLNGEAASGKPFAVFTLDDGYKDNRDFAYPIFKRHGVPFTIYVPTEYADGNGELWWLALDEALRRLPSLEIERDGAVRVYPLTTNSEKTAAFHDIYWWLRRIPEIRARAIVRGLAAKAGFDIVELCRELVMSWDEIRTFAEDPLVTIAAHTRSHFALAKLSAEEARGEMADSIARVANELGKPCRHFSYPYGDQGSVGDREFEIAHELGIETAVTTRKGLLRTSNGKAMMALPRLSLNGDYQDLRYVKVLLSGLPFALRDGVKRVLAPLSGRGSRGEEMSAVRYPASASTR
jgi:peptidoglycan/xylan/chitin deacetylase (PgdA/CDA1 family)